jgi:hypothetical protein
MPIIEFDEECKSCAGTGLYIGIAERDGSAVVCHNCKGTGCHHYKYEYAEFRGRKVAGRVKRVYEVNPGICIGTGNGLKHEDFGGIPFGEWQAGGKFGPGTENRRFTCPAWWYQLADYSKKPGWHECLCCGSFDRCEHFPTKDACWERWDKENRL